MVIWGATTILFGGLLEDAAQTVGFAATFPVSSIRHFLDGDIRHPDSVLPIEIRPCNICGHAFDQRVVTSNWTA
jgi:hypothetical protein